MSDVSPAVDDVRVGVVLTGRAGGPSSADPVSAEVLLSAVERDAAARARDAVAGARDRTAAARDVALEKADAALMRDGRGPVTGGEVLLLAGALRRRVAAYSTRVLSHRKSAADDRRAAALDRELAARDRRQSLADCQALVRTVVAAQTDQLTGARSRAAGLAELDRELDRCRRTGRPLTVAYIDAVGLKHLNDTQGHTAGDEMLRRVVAQINEQLRSYDLIIRLGGDEFLCSITDATLFDTQARFRAIASAIRAQNPSDQIHTGFAQLTAEQTAAQLIAQADQQLIKRPADHSIIDGAQASGRVRTSVRSEHPVMEPRPDADLRSGRASTAATTGSDGGQPLGVR